MILLHNPRCSKSRQAKEYLEEKWVKFEIREYLKNPLSLSELEELKEALGLAAIDFCRFKEPEFIDAGLAKDAPDSEILEAISTHPKLLERPILISWDRAKIGRPLENLFGLLEDK